MLDIEENYMNCSGAMAISFDRTFRMRKSLTMAFVSVRANQTMNGTAANHVKMKLNGSGNCKTEMYLRNSGRSRKRHNNLDTNQINVETLKLFRELYGNGYLQKVCDLKPSQIIQEKEAGWD